MTLLHGPGAKGAGRWRGEKQRTPDADSGPALRSLLPRSAEDASGAEASRDLSTDIGLVVRGGLFAGEDDGIEQAEPPGRGSPDPAAPEPVTPPDRGWGVRSGGPRPAPRLQMRGQRLDVFSRMPSRATTGAVSPDGADLTADGSSVRGETAPAGPGDRAVQPHEVTTTPDRWADQAESADGMDVADGFRVPEAPMTTPISTLPDASPVAALPVIEDGTTLEAALYRIADAGPGEVEVLEELVRDAGLLMDAPTRIATVVGDRLVWTAAYGDDRVELGSEVLLERTACGAAWGTALIQHVASPDTDASPSGGGPGELTTRCCDGAAAVLAVPLLRAAPAMTGRHASITREVLAVLAFTADRPGWFTDADIEATADLAEVAGERIATLEEAVSEVVPETVLPESSSAPFDRWFTPAVPATPIDPDDPATSAVFGALAVSGPLEPAGAAGAPSDFDPFGLFTPPGPDEKAGEEGLSVFDRFFGRAAAVAEEEPAEAGSPARAVVPESGFAWGAEESLDEALSADEDEEIVLPAETATAEVDLASPRPNGRRARRAARPTQEAARAEEAARLAEERARAAACRSDERGPEAVRPADGSGRNESAAGQSRESGRAESDVRRAGASGRDDAAGGSGRTETMAWPTGEIAQDEEIACRADGSGRDDAVDEPGRTETGEAAHRPGETDPAVRRADEPVPVEAEDRPAGEAGLDDPADQQFGETADPGEEAGAGEEFGAWVSAAARAVGAEEDWTEEDPAEATPVDVTGRTGNVLRTEEIAEAARAARAERAAREEAQDEEAARTDGTARLNRMEDATRARGAAWADTIDRAIREPEPVENEAERTENPDRGEEIGVSSRVFRSETDSETGAGEEVWLREDVLDLDGSRPARRPGANRIRARLAELRESPRVVNRSGGTGSGRPGTALGVLTPPDGSEIRDPRASSIENARMPGPRTQRNRPPGGPGLPTSMPSADSMGLWQWDAETNTVTWSSPVARLLGLPADAQLDLSVIRTALAGADRGRFDVAVQAVLSGRGVAGALRLRTHDGHAKHAYAWSEVRRDDSGRLLGAWGGVVDITAFERDAASLRSGLAGLRAAQELAGLATWEWRPETAELIWSDEMYRLVGVPGETFEPDLDRWQAFVHPDDLARARRVDVDLVAAEGDDGCVETFRLIGTGGEIRHVQSWATPGRGPDGTVNAVYGATIDVTRQVKDRIELERLASTDPVTGLGNRSAYDRRAQALLRASQPTPGTDENAVSVLLLDLDRFKVVNDGLGHETADRLLIEVARRLVAVVPDGSLIARAGGDAFVLLAPAGWPLGQVVDIARTVLEALRAPYVLPESGEVLICPGTVGIASNRGRPGATSADLLREAGVALHRAKDAGRDGYAVFDEELREHVRDRRRSEQRLRLALAGDGLMLEYQPIIDLVSNRIVGAEALVRLLDPDGGEHVLTPGRFLDVAEKTGLIVDVDTWVINSVIGQLRSWSQNSEQLRAADARIGDQSGRGRVETPWLSINLSARSTEHPGLAFHLIDAVRRGDFGPEKLKVELTEEAFVNADPAVDDALRQLISAGIGVGIDDFGSGHSALTSLQSHTFDFMKIDRSFVAPVGQDSRADAVVTAVVDLAHAHGMRVVAEGVESGRQARRLREIGCDYAQGYHFGRPGDVTRIIRG